MSGLLFWSDLAQTILNSDHPNYFGLKMGLNFPQKSNMKNAYSNQHDFVKDYVGDCCTH